MDPPASKTAKTRAPAPGSPAPPADGVPLADLLQLNLSPSVRNFLETGRHRAVDERFRGLFGTGLLLICLVETGRKPRKSDGARYAPRELARLIDRFDAAGFDRARDQFFEENRLAADQPTNPPSHASVSLREVFDAALTLPRHDGYLAARHLIVALLSHTPAGRPVPTNAWRILDAAGISRASVLSEFLASLATDGPPEEQAEWRRRFTDLPPDPITPGVPPALRGRPLASFDTDTPSGRAADDCLNLESTVGAMASLIASPQLVGNLSLGVFGHWGSGKSFFMRRLRGAIDELTHVSRGTSASHPTATPDYWPNIAQVEFNAWHYVDANLWASLMAHLLEELRRWDPTETGRTQTPLQRALDQLQLTSVAREDAKRQCDAAHEAKTAADNLLANARTNLDHAVENLTRETRRSLWDFIGDRLAPQRQDLAAALAQLGLESAGTQTSLQSLYAHAQGLATTSGRLHAIALRLLNSPKGSRKLLEMLGLVGLPLLAVLLLAATPFGEWARNGLTPLTTTVVGALAAATRGLAWVRTQAAQVLALLTPLLAAKQTVDAALANAEEQKALEIARREKDVAIRRAEVDAAVAALAEREKDLQSAIDAVGHAVSGRAISRFISERLATGDYQKHLGLIALIRRDFEQLSHLVSAHNALRRQLPDEARAIELQLKNARPDLDPADVQALFQNLGINRIVLYIDDLDRCPSSRVVEVLQAIHLLLAFPVFVVVVGVDSRWMAHSLAKEYPALLARTRRDQVLARAWSHEAGLSPVTPSDYLEKIFQIPFWIPPLNSNAARALIHKLTAQPTDGAAEPKPTPSANDQPDDAPNPLDPTHPTEPTPPANLDPSPRDPARPAPTPQTSPSDATLTNPTDTAANRTTPATIEAYRPERLVLSEAERTAMGTLAPLIGRSPRATKRFVNSYRLLRAALTQKERVQFGVREDRLGGMATPMFLLAVVTGTPAFAAGLLAALEADPSRSPLVGLQSLAEIHGPDPDDTVARIQTFCTSDDARFWRQQAFPHLAAWATRVAQFSFENLGASRPDPDSVPPHSAPPQSNDLPPP